MASAEPIAFSPLSRLEEVPPFQIDWAVRLVAPDTPLRFIELSFALAVRMLDGVKVETARVVAGCASLLNELEARGVSPFDHSALLSSVVDVCSRSQGFAAEYVCAIQNVLKLTRERRDESTTRSAVEKACLLLEKVTDAGAAFCAEGIIGLYRGNQVGRYMQALGELHAAARGHEYAMWNAVDQLALACKHDIPLQVLLTLKSHLVSCDGERLHHAVYGISLLAPHSLQREVADRRGKLMFTGACTAAFKILLLHPMLAVEDIYTLGRRTYKQLFGRSLGDEARGRFEAATALAECLSWETICSVGLRHGAKHWQESLLNRAGPILARYREAEMARQPVFVPTWNRARAFEAVLINDALQKNRVL